MRVSMKFTVAILIAALAMSGFALSTGTPAAAGEAMRYVILGAGSLPVGFDSLIASIGGRVVARLDEIGAAIVESDEPTFLYAADALPGIAGVAEDVALQIESDPVSGIVVEGIDGIAVEGLNPAGARFVGAQWGLHNVGADQAWAAGFRGNAAVKVAILDSGIDISHQEFSNGKVIAALSKSFFPESLPMGAPAYLDVHGHGSHVAGIISTNGISFASVAPDVKLIAVKVSGRAGFTTLGTLAQAIVYAAGVGADVINMSFGSSGLSKDDLRANHLKQVLWLAMNYAHSKGALLVASAGNLAIDWDGSAFKQLTKFPVQLNHVVGVSATGPFFGAEFDSIGVALTTSGDYLEYTDYGKSVVDFAAPGGSRTTYLVSFPGMPPAPADWVLSVCARFSSSTCGSGRAGTFMVGSSMAAAHVSGVAALIDSAYGGRLTGDQIVALLKKGAEDFGKPGFDEFYGHGRINVYRSLTLNK